MKTLLIGLLLVLAIPVFGLPFGIDRFLYVFAAIVIFYGLYRIFRDPKDGAEKKTIETEEKEKGIDSNTEDQEREVEASEEAPAASVGLTEAEKKEISKSVQDS